VAHWSVQVKGATFVWDGDANASNNVHNLSGTAPTATNFGGAGTWAAANTFWNGTTNQAWSNAGLDTAWFAGLSGGAVALTGNQTVGGLIFTTGNYSTTLTGANTLTLGGAPGANIISAYAGASIGTASVNGILGTNGLIKNGGGTLTVLGTNTGFSGAVAVNGGALTLNGGANLGQTQLNTSTITLNFGTLNILNNGAGSNTAAAIAYGNDVVINGNSTIGVNNAGANTNNTIAIPSLTVNNSAVTFTSANGYGLQVTGATTLFGAITTLNSGFNPLPSGAAGVAASANNTAQLVALTGAVGGSGALNKQGAGTVTLQASNTYSGGTNILAGSLLLNTNAATLSSGKVIVNPGTTLGIVSSGNVTGSNLYLPSRLDATGGTVAILRANANADLSGGSLNAAVVGTYGASYQLDTGTTGVAGAAGSNAIFDPNTGAYVAAATYLQSIDLNNFGSTAAGTGRIMLGSTAANTTMSGTVSNSSGGDIRFGGSGILTLSATDALGTTAQTVQIGSPIVNAQPLTGATGTTAFSGANNTNYTGTMTVNKGSTLQAPALTGTNVFGTGPLTVLGGSVNVLNNVTATNYTGGPQIGNSVINLYPSAGVVTGAGSLFTLDNSAVTTGGGTTNLRLVGTTPINAYGGSTFSLIGSNTGATTTTQNTGAYGFQGGNVINLSTNTTAATNADGVITIANLVRNGNGTMAFTRAVGSPTAFGTSTANNDARINLTQLNGATPVVTNGSIAPWLVDQTSNTFLTYGANGIAPVIYSAATLATATANDLVTSGAVAITANSTVHALQLTGTITQTGGPFTITIGANSTATDGAGLIMTSASTHTPNFSFGTAGAREAVIYNSAAVTLSGTIAASGLTKFGTGTLTLTGVNSGLTGTITGNQGILVGSAVGYNFRPITIAGGSQVDFNGTGNGIYLNDVTVTGESIISAGGGTPRINSLTIAARLGTATAPVSLMVNSGTVVGNYGSTYVSGSGTSITGGGLVLDAPTNWISGTAATSGTAAANTNILGIVSGTGALNKWGNAPLSFSNAGNTYSGGTVVNGAGGD
ncbi:MAG: autotransporter-associated beta strand repeat-containing protein, partial [Verrucomicrobia bacterium]|nr:autotransporter-associated beta strand repeat-containing protein [Verrucomicrobiota bacterium]